MATAGISLIRPHTEGIKPPRALWVPFELGRPLGPPNEPEFQMGVLKALLALTSAKSGPVLEDYPLEAPSRSDEAEEPWACALPPPPLEVGIDEEQRVRLGVVREAGLLRPWYDESLRRLGRTAFGVTGLGVDDLEVIAAFLASFAYGGSPKLPEGALSAMPGFVRHCADDLKSYYFEAVSAQPGRRARPVELREWLFRETALGELIQKVRARVVHLGEGDETYRLLAGQLLPVEYLPRS